jgi:hypothetical protein
VAPIDDYYVVCDVKYEAKNISTKHAIWKWEKQIKIGQLAVNPADVMALPSESHSGSSAKT